MKKSYLMMAAAATMLAACTQTDLVQEVNTQQAISFEGFAGKTTRAEITEVGDLKKVGVGFKVWGYATDSESNTTEVFNSEDVTWNSTKSVWEYTGLQYWDAAKTYSFYAVAPISANTAWDNTNGEYTISNVESGKASVVTDYLTATPKTGIPGSLGQVVDFNFNHVMSKVSVELATTATNVTVHSVEMTGWDSGDGAYNSSESPAWTIASSGSDAASIYGLADGVFNPIAVANTELSSFLVVPQEVSTLRFTLTYKVGEVLFTDNYVDITAQDWAVNEHTTYTINIGAGPITFGVTSVKGWSNTPEGGLTVE